jgi:ribosomal subunit interface protein
MRQDDLQITFRDIRPSPSVAARIKKRVRKLEEFHDRILRCHVVVEAARRRTKAIAYQVHIDLRLPGSELAVSHDHFDHRPIDDMDVAIRGAFDAMERRLKGTTHRQHGEAPKKRRARRVAIKRVGDGVGER